MAIYVVFRESKSWISTTIDINKAFAFITFDGEYITYSRWLEGEPRRINHQCVVVDGNNYWRSGTCGNRNAAVCFLNLTLNLHNGLLYHV